MTNCELGAETVMRRLKYIGSNSEENIEIWQMIDASALYIYTTCSR